MANQYSITTRFGAHIVELSESEEQALINEGGVTQDSRGVLANAALILAYLAEGPAAPGEIAKAAGINSQTSGSWKKAVVALREAGLIERSGYGPATEYSRTVRAEEPLTGLEASNSWEFEPHHTIILGGKSTGKSNLLHTLIRQQAASVKAGTAKLYGIDPVDTELAPYEGNLFARVSAGADQQGHLALLREVDEEVSSRLRPTDVSGLRSVKPTVERPFILLFIEELDWVLNDEEAADCLVRILALGRAAGVYIIATTEILSRGRSFRLIPEFSNRIIFRQGSRFLNDLVLGEGAAEAGADSTALKVASHANGYEGAGVAFVADGLSIRKVQLPEITAEETAGLIREFRAQSV
ncbi:winged helix-turn-helix domain-containing protein [Rathayibacter rathayi]|uniref:winged helix-turn-helix domain-containing protein n=1 Tax=Rathayibacter rathayi TaxID=33887 RepID=UPI000CE8B480|nr:winged helix-turn-helix domain-containing protein [Rathayibacter rathayi]PPF51985.1 hypothetical protein C5C08_01120 [Rathayibacter rathayi]PPF83592.1 hypothetical protein C5C14_01120 [Rathayibacter rathayi]PPG16141.1 hypothetical protein C5C11_00325 [Rathayibacter rathayi]PPG47411.1 hypothetical protein C5C20_01125 [Rathayibacter rathayi]PPI04976.1 hypothetical protein C5C43_01125 [Rathayibacter rathayi]